MQYVTAEHTSIRGASFLNRAQFGFTRSRLDGYDYTLPGANLPRTTFTNVTDGILTLSVTGLTGYGGDATNPKYHRFNNFQFRDNVTYTRGGHILKIGGDIQVLQYHLLSDFTSMGQYTFTSIPNFLNASVNQFSAVVPGSDASRDLRQIAYGLYVQDYWQLRKNLTLNLGVRYEPTSSITDSQGRLAQLIDFASPTATLKDTTVLPDGLFKNPSLKTVAPRFAFAWDVAGNGKTAVRGGVGIFYDDILVSTPFVQNTADRVPPFINRGGLVAKQGLVINFPDAFTEQQAQIAGESQLEGIQYNLDQPYVEKWNLNLQRELFGKTTVEIGYSGNHGVHLVRQIFTNGRLATPGPYGTWYAPPTESLTQPNFGRMRLRVSDATSSYHGLNLSVTRRFANGLQAQAAYTYSKSIDDGAAALGGTDFTTEGGGSRYLFTKDRGLSPFDLRHSFVGSINYLLPFARNATGLQGALEKEWNVGVLVRMRSGYRFSALSGFDTGGQGAGWAPDYANLKSGANNNPVFSSPRPCAANASALCWFDPTVFAFPAPGYTGNVGRNTIVGPGLQTVDLIVSKNVPFGNKRDVQLRFECFNLLNRANFGVPSNTIFNPQDGSLNANAGRITTVLSPARQIQLGMKVVW